MSDRQAHVGVGIASAAWRWWRWAARFVAVLAFGGLLYAVVDLMPWWVSFAVGFVLFGFVISNEKDWWG